MKRSRGSVLLEHALLLGAVGLAVATVLPQFAGALSDAFSCQGARLGGFGEAPTCTETVAIPVSAPAEGRVRNGARQPPLLLGAAAGQPPVSTGSGLTDSLDGLSVDAVRARIDAHLKRHDAGESSALDDALAVAIAARALRGESHFARVSEHIGPGSRDNAYVVVAERRAEILASARGSLRVLSRIEEGRRTFGELYEMLVAIENDPDPDGRAYSILRRVQSQRKGEASAVEMIQGAAFDAVINSAGYGRFRGEINRALQQQSLQKADEQRRELQKLPPGARFLEALRRGMERAYDEGQGPMEQIPGVGPMDGVPLMRK